MQTSEIEIGSATVHVALLSCSGRPAPADSVRLMQALLARRLGGTGADWSVGHDANGAPVALRQGVAQPVFISLSRTDGMAAACLSLSPVGIDVERIEAHAADPDLAAGLFSQAEQAHLAKAGMDPETFFRIWTLKEAYIKARGLGFGIDLPGFSVVAEGHLGRLVPAPGDPGQWTLRSEMPGTGHVTGIAVMKP